jgi:peptide/nickel transport system substrate-binding protein
VETLSVLVLLATGCTGRGHVSPSPSQSSGLAHSGGTLHVGVYQWYGKLPHDPTTLIADLPGLDQCCLLRTLMSYNGTPTSEGGAILRPDLATTFPEVSSDGLTWTFHLKGGLSYAPPLQHTRISTPDVIRAVERMLIPTPKPYVAVFGPTLGNGSDYFTAVVQGAQDYAEGRASLISGLEAPDASTLRVHLTRPFGDLPYLFALVGTAPIPPNPFHPEARFGVADGHVLDGYGNFLVSSGPYMIEGSQKLDFSKPPDQQEPPSGLDPLVLVRNPSWRRGTDDLRPAYPDRIEFTAYDDKPYKLDSLFAVNPAVFRRAQSAEAKEVDNGTLDVVLDSPAPYSQVQRYLADATLRHRVSVNEFGDIRFLSLNLGRPPFDDVHVRRAINYAIDKQRILDLWNRSENSAQVADHMAPDATEDDLLLTFNPYPTTDHEGDVSAAMREMRLSAYDRDGDGRCDAAACRDVSILWRTAFGYDTMAPAVRKDLARIGIQMKFKLVTGGEMYQWCGDPSAHATLCQIGWGADYPSASTFFEPLYGAESLADGNGFSLLGASAAALRRWGYPVTSVPSVQGRLDECDRAVGSASLRCWASFDQYLMTDVVPAVPILADTAPWTFSARVKSFSFDQVTGAPALDRIAVQG